MVSRQESPARETEYVYFECRSLNREFAKVSRFDETPAGPLRAAMAVRMYLR